MELNEIKILVIKKGLNMKMLSERLGISREYMYRQIRLKDNKIMKKIKKILL